MNRHLASISIDLSKKRNNLEIVKKMDFVFSEIIDHIACLIKYNIYSKWSSLDINIS